MAATVTVDKTISLGGTENLYLGTIALDASYPTGGEAIDATNNERFEYLLASPTSGYVFQWDAANQKLLAFRGDNANAAAAPMVEVAAAVDLSALTAIPFWAVGQ